MNKPNKTELEYFIRYSLDSDKYKRYMELYDEIERLKQEYIILQNVSDEVEENLQQRIDKAIEHIKLTMSYEKLVEVGRADAYKQKGETKYEDILREEDVKKVLNILQGSDKE